MFLLCSRSIHSAGTARSHPSPCSEGQHSWHCPCPLPRLQQWVHHCVQLMPSCVSVRCAMSRVLSALLLHPCIICIFPSVRAVSCVLMSLYLSQCPCCVSYVCPPCPGRVFVPRPYVHAMFLSMSHVPVSQCPVPLPVLLLSGPVSLCPCVCPLSVQMPVSSRLCPTPRCAHPDVPVPASLLNSHGEGTGYEGRVSSR